MAEPTSTKESVSQTSVPTQRALLEAVDNFADFISVHKQRVRHLFEQVILTQRYNEEGFLYEHNHLAWRADVKLKMEFGEPELRVKLPSAGPLFPEAGDSSHSKIVRVRHGVTGWIRYDNTEDLRFDDIKEFASELFDLQPGEKLRMQVFYHTKFRKIDFRVFGRGQRFVVTFKPGCPEVDIDEEYWEFKV